MLVSCSGDVFIRPEQMRVVLANIIISVPNLKKQTQYKKIWKIRAFWSRCEGCPSTDGRRNR